MELNDDARTYVKALVYGKPGTGKTTFGVSAPKPLILLSERQAMTHVRHAVSRLGTSPQVLYMETLQDYRDVLRTLVLATHDPSLRDGPFVIRNESGATVYESKVWPESIVLDSLTDAMKLVEEEILRQAPPKRGKDGLDVMAERYWQALADRCEKLVRAFRDVDFNVIFLALEDDKTIGEGDEAERVVTPSMPMRKLPAVVAAAVNVVGVTVRQIARGASEDGEAAEAQIRFGVRTVGPGYYLLKPYRPLADVEVPDFSDWVARINAAIRHGDDAEEARPKAARKTATRKQRKNDNDQNNEETER